LRSARPPCDSPHLISPLFRVPVAVPQAEFVHYLQSRMADPSRTDLLSFSYI